MSTTGDRARPGAVRESARRRRVLMLEAALRIMARDGLRAVSHRAVAAEAGVPLAATTYYFSDLEDLITEAFLHWSDSQQRLVVEFHAAATAMVAQGVDRGSADAFVDALAEAAAAYVLDQTGEHRPDRVLEFAFLHEAARMPKLREVVRARQLEDRGFLEQFHAALGSARPGVDAQISYSLLLGLEKAAVLGDPRYLEPGAIREVVAHYLRSLLAAGDAAVSASGALQDKV